MDNEATWLTVWKHRHVRSATFTRTDANTDERSRVIEEPFETVVSLTGQLCVGAFASLPAS